MRNRMWWAMVLVLGMILILMLSWSPHPSVAQDTPTPTVVISSDPMDYAPLLQGRGVANSIAWSPDGTLLAIGGTRGLWLYTNTLQELSHPDIPENQVTVLDWSSDGRYLAGGNYNGTVWVWDVTRAEVVAVLQGEDEDGTLLSLDWSPDSTRIVSSAIDGVIRVWDVATGQTLQVLDFPDPDISYGPYTDYPDRAYALCWHPEGAYIAAQIKGFVLVFDAATSKIVWHVSPPPSLNTAAWSPDGTLLAVAGEIQAFVPEPDGFVRYPKGIDIWDAASREAVIMLEGHTESIKMVVWSPDSRRLASIGFDQTVRVWDVTTGEMLAVFDGPLFVRWNYTDDWLAWSPDGSTLASVGDDGFVRLWDMDTYEVLIAWQGFNGFVEAETSPPEN